jgi:S1-C subfamily serine protease
VPLNFVATLDIIGGSSGSPVVNRDGEIVGLVFDGNLEGLGGRFVYTDEKARAIAVDARAIVEALGSVYGAGDLIAEITRAK